MVEQYLPQTNENGYSVLQCPMWLFLPPFQGSKHTPCFILTSLNWRIKEMIWHIEGRECIQTILVSPNFTPCKINLEREAYAWGGLAILYQNLACRLRDGKLLHIASDNLRPAPHKKWKIKQKAPEMCSCMILLSSILLQTVQHTGFHLQSPGLVLCRLPHPDLQ